MQIEKQYTRTLCATTRLLELIVKCKHKDSEDGEEISVNEFEDIIFPAQAELQEEVNHLYRILVEERSKKKQTLISLCVKCDRVNTARCTMFSGMDNVKASEFKFYAERHGNGCVTFDSDATARDIAENGIFLPEINLGDLVSEKKDSD